MPSSEVGLAKSCGRKGVDWLWSIRNKEFGWGDRAGSAVDLAGCAEVLRGMLKAGVDFRSEKFQQSFTAVKKILAMKPSESPVKKEYVESVREEAWMTLLLLEVGEDPQSPFMKDRFAETEAYKAGDAWREPTDKGNVFDTALMVRCLAANKKANRTTLNKAVDWLKNAQRKDGGWGFHPDSHESNNISTMMTIIALHDSGQLINSTYLQNAKKWVLSHRESDGGWSATIEKLPHVRYGQWFHYTKPHGLISLLKMDFSPKSEEVKRAVKSLCADQDASGGWKTSKDSIPFTHATGHSLSALGEYMSRA